MSCLIAIETAADACSVACMLEGTLLMESTLYRPRSHSERLITMIEDVLTTSGVEGLDAIAVSAGPGSYTGLRIGVSTAKGLAMAYDADLVAVPTLEALAAAARPVGADDDLVASMLRARRSEWYAGAYRLTRDGIAVAPVEAPSLVLEDVLATWMARLGAPSALWLVTAGDMPPKIQHDGSVRVLSQDATTLQAGRVAGQGWLRWQKGMIEDVSRLEPQYLRPYRPKKAASPFTEP